PGENVAIFGDALRRLSDQSTHLTLDGQRYWYATQPTVTRLAQDRAAQLDEERVLEEIEKRLRAEQNTRGDFAKVHPCPTSSAEIPDDELSARLVILKPQYTHALRDTNSLAEETAREVLDHRGNALRNYRNTLVFLAADRNRLEDLKQGMRQYLAWESIYTQSDPLNLDPFQRNQAKIKCNEANESVERRIPETYIWLLVPDQPDPHQSAHLQELRLQQPQGPLAINASRRIKTEEMLIIDYAGTLLRGEMDRIPLWRGNHVSIKELASFFASYIYLPRLKNTEVLLEAIRKGIENKHWQQETFAYAERWDVEQSRYLGLKTGQVVQVAIDATSVLIKPEVALAQRAADEAAEQARKAKENTYQDNTTHTGPTINERGGTTVLDPPVIIHTPTPPPMPGAPGNVPPASESELQYHRFYGSIKINPRTMAGDAGKIMEEVVKHMTTIMGSDVQVTVEIEARMPKGVTESTKRTIEENCKTLKFDDFGFEVE
ncbi:MAG TPA: hypothetical protein VEI53_08075, partial [Ktedonobacteraceae bacterium]|nr:hypothetical protein [Ktedonobacteraceae bacterium]